MMDSIHSTAVAIRFRRDGLLTHRWPSLASTRQVVTNLLAAIERRVDSVEQAGALREVAENQQPGSAHQPADQGVERGGNAHIGRVAFLNSVGEDRRGKG